MIERMNVKKLAFGAAAIAVAGCAETHPETPGPVTPTAAAPHGAPQGPAAVAQIDANLARLQALDVVQIGTLLVEYPEGSHNCYGPCPGSEPAIEAAKQKAAERLAAFVAKAEAAARSPSPGPCDATIDENLAALQSLKVVSVTGFAKTTAVQKANCYGACPEDIAAAKAVDAQKACRLDAIVKSAKL